MDFYQTLGVTKNATQDEIKQAYRKLAGKHHPDKGGDTAVFQTISQAYDTLGDTIKRARYDAQTQTPNRSRNHFTTNNIDDLFRNIRPGQNPFEQAFKFQKSQQVHRKNKDLNIKAKISFKQSYTGAILEATYQTPSGKKKNVIIKIPEGVSDGQVIKYHGLGDDSNQKLLNGDLIVSVIVETCEIYSRRNNDLLTVLDVNPIEAMIGCAKVVETIDGNKMNITIRPGVCHGTEYMTKGLGFTSPQGTKGNFVVLINIKVPAVVDPVIKEKLEQIYAEINTTE